jgi:hypothetical protein
LQLALKGFGATKLSTMSEVVPVSNSDDVEIHANLQRFEQMLLAQLATQGLPVDAVLVAQNNGWCSQTVASR